MNPQVGLKIGPCSGDLLFLVLSSGIAQQQTSLSCSWLLSPICGELSYSSRSSLHMQIALVSQIFSNLLTILATFQGLTVICHYIFFKIQDSALNPTHNIWFPQHIFNKITIHKGELMYHLLRQFPIVQSQFLTESGLMHWTMICY